MSTRKLELKSLAPKAQGFLRHGDQRRVRRTLRRGPRGVADGQPAKIPAPLCVRHDPPRDTGTKEERLCGLAVEPRRSPFNKAVETGPRGIRGNPSAESSGVDSREKLGWGSA